MVPAYHWMVPDEPAKMENIVKSVQTRSIRVVKASNSVESISSNDLKTSPGRIDQIIEKLEGEGAWVKILKFIHE